MSMMDVGSAAQKRSQLADFYDQETANRLELARFAHEAGLKNSFDNLVNMANRSRTYAKQARARAALQTLLGAKAQEHNAKQTGLMPPAEMGPGSALPQGVMTPPGVAGGPAPLPGATPIPQYKFGTGEALAALAGLAVGPAMIRKPITDRLGLTMSNEDAAAMFGMPAMAAGGTHPGGPALVGEQGPEVVDLPAGATVHPNPQTSMIGIIRSLLDMLEGGAAAPMGPVGGPGQVAGEGGSPAYAYGTPDAHRPVPAYAFGTRASSGYGGLAQRTAGRLPNRPQSGPGAPAGFVRDAAGNLRRYGGSGDFVSPEGQFSANQALQSMQLRAADAGAYDPLGSQQVANLERESILGSLGARQEQSAKIADLYGGGDPQFRAYLRAQAAANTQSEAAQAFREARARQAQGGQDFARQVFLGGQLPATVRKDPKEPNPLAAVGGQIAGAALGAIPGVGGMVKSGGTTSGSLGDVRPWYYG